MGEGGRKNRGRNIRARGAAPRRQRVQAGTRGVRLSRAGVAQAASLAACASGGLADCAAVGHPRDVQVLGPLLLDVRAGEGAGAQRLLRLVHRPPLGHAAVGGQGWGRRWRCVWVWAELKCTGASGASGDAPSKSRAAASAVTPATKTRTTGRLPPHRTPEHKGRLVGRGCAGGDAVARVPPPVDALAGVLEVQLHALGGEGEGHAGWLARLEGEASGAQLWNLNTWNKRCMCRHFCRSTEMLSAPEPQQPPASPGPQSPRCGSSPLPTASGWWPWPSLQEGMGQPVQQHISTSVITTRCACTQPQPGPNPTAALAAAHRRSPPSTSC